MTPPSSTPDDIFTSRRHSMDYFTVDGVKLRTGYQHERDWYLLPIRELLDNAADFLTMHYRGANDTYIKTWITKDDEFLRIRVRNSNYKNIPVLQDLDLIFDYDMRYGSKQNVYVISRGMLGDALKQILSLGYVLIHLNDDGNSFVDEQWNQPLLIRHNRKEQKVFLHVDKANQTAEVNIENSSEELACNGTEIEVTLPSNVGLFMPKSDIVKFCKRYPIFTTDIPFEFRIADDSTEPQEYEGDNWVTSDEAILKALSREPPRAITKVEYPAVHPISKERWTNSNSIWAYRPEEFVNRIVNVHDKNSIIVYDVLRTYREGSNMAKTSDTAVSIAELMLDPEKNKKIEKWYKQLKKTLPPSEELSLPYTTTNQDRKNALVSRIAQLYDIDEEKMEQKYKVIRGFYRDDIWKKVWINGGEAYREEKGRGVIQFPFLFEILAVPLNKPLENKTDFIGAVNYSISPLSNTFEGDYRWHDDDGKKKPSDLITSDSHTASDIIKVLSHYGFHRYYGSKSKISCVIIANLVTPRRDPHGYDKSRIDTQPFAETIAEAVKKVAAEIQTFRVAGYKFTDESDYRTATWHSVEKKRSVKELLKEFLVKERGMPA
jgi:hypothetical protein